MKRSRNINSAMFFSHRLPTDPMPRPPVAVVFEQSVSSISVSAIKTRSRGGRRLTLESKRNAIWRVYGVPRCGRTTPREYFSEGKSEVSCPTYFFRQPPVQCTTAGSILLREAAQDSQGACPVECHQDPTITVDFATRCVGLLASPGEHKSSGGDNSKESLLHAPTHVVPHQDRRLSGSAAGSNPARSTPLPASGLPPAPPVRCPLCDDR